MIHVRMVFLESIPSAFLSSLDLLNVLGIDPPQDAPTCQGKELLPALHSGRVDSLLPGD